MPTEEYRSYTGSSLQTIPGGRRPGGSSAKLPAVLIVIAVALICSAAYLYLRGKREKEDVPPPTSKKAVCIRALYTITTHNEWSEKRKRWTDKPYRTPIPQGACGMMVDSQPHDTGGAQPLYKLVWGQFMGPNMVNKPQDIPESMHHWIPVGLVQQVDCPCIPIQAPTPTPDSYIPSIDAEAIEIRFFNSGCPDMEEKEQEYGTRFPLSQACYINWKLTIKVRTLPTEYKSVQINDHWIRMNESAFDGDGASEDVTPNSPTTLWIFGKRGQSEPGQWQVGKYRVELSVDNQKKISGTFEIYDDASDEVDPDPAPTPHERARQIKGMNQQ